MTSYIFAQKYSSCKVFTSENQLEKLSNLGIAIDHGTHKKGHYFISDFSEYEIKLMKKNGFELEVLIDDVSAYYVERSKNKKNSRNSSCSNAINGEITVPQNFNLGAMAGFYTYQEYLDEIDQMASLYPNLITLKSPISNFQTHEGRPIYWLKISDNPNQDENEPEVLYSAIHHAREPMSLTSTIFYMWYLLENYENNPEIQFLINETEMFFIPMLNPDGYVQNVTNNPNGGGMFRKNKRNNGDGTFGVDLNRNYNHEWGTTGVSFNTNSDTYPGTAAFSEPETQAMKWFCENRNILYAFNAHSYSNLILFPIGSTSDVFADDHDYFQTIGDEMVRYNGFLAQKSSLLYPASGDSDDYMYLEDLNVKPKIFAFTPEIGSDADGFWPAEVDLTPIAQSMIHSNLVLAHAPHNYWTVIENDPHTLITLTGNFNHNVVRLGMSDLPLIVEIEALQNIVSLGQSHTYTLAINVPAQGEISYTLNPSINLGDTVKYILKSNFGNYISRDTIVKIYGNPTLQYENLGNTTNDWTGNWNVTSEDFYSPSSSFTDSPNGNYSNFAYKTYTLNQEINLQNAVYPKVEFFAKWRIENNFDYARLEISTDNGANWIGQCGKYTNLGVSGNGGVQSQDEPVYDGIQNEWVLEEISLSDYIGETIKIRFVFASDAGVRDDGFYFDDFKILYNINTAKLKEKQAESFFISPNPSNDNCTIHSSFNLNNSEIIIEDFNGKVVYSEKINYNTNEKEMNFALLSNGIYFVNLTSKSGEIVKSKLLIQK